MSSSGSNTIRHQSGLVLVVVLWFIVFMTVLAVTFSSSLRTEVRATRNLVDDLMLRQLADGAVHIGINTLLNRTPDSAFAIDPAPREYQYAGAVLTVALQDETGLVDLNRGEEAVLEAVLLEAGADAEQAAKLVDAIADWRDPDDLKRLNGAELDDYRAAGLAARPANAPFASVAALQEVIGMPRDLYERVAPLLTVHSVQGLINPMVAPERVLRLLPGIDPQALQTYIAEREVFFSGESIEPPLLDLDAEWLTVDPGNAYRVRGTARIGARSRSVETIVWFPQTDDARLFYVLDTRQNPAMDRNRQATGSGSSS